MALYQSSKTPPPPGRTEFEILKASHRFLREDGKNLSWDEQLASKYYDSLYREFAVCDLKHYKSGNFALRWRTEAEVLSGAGETTCGNTRCQHHELPRRPSGTIPPTLTTLQLPFTYVEQGETKSALVKMVLCDRCFDKLMWKRRKEKERQVLADAGEVAAETETSGNANAEPEAADGGRGSVNPRATKMEEVEARKGWGRRREDEDRAADEKRRQRRRSSRSQSPRSRHKSDARSLRRSPKHRSS